MNEKIPSELPTPANDNQTERAFEKERVDTFQEILLFRKTVDVSDLLAKEKNTFLIKIDKILNALHEGESAPKEALSRIQTLATEYGLDSYFHTT